MAHKQTKGQSLVEFALILPILLLLLLGIIEGSRIIWAYITVQTAAREAARYAITGQPYIDPSLGSLGAKNAPGGACHIPEGDEAGVRNTWLCEPESRAEAIKAVAQARGDTLMNVNECPTDLQLTGNVYDPSWRCGGLPGVFGVQVVGQEIDETSGSTTPAQIANHAGEEGLNVVVETFYNVQMLDPLFDTFLGGASITVRGSAQMQNEGISPVQGAIPPPTINSSTTISGSTTTGSSNRIPTVFVLGSHPTEAEPVEPGMPLVIAFEDHEQLLGPYDAWLQAVNEAGLPTNEQYPLCSLVPMNNNDYGEDECTIPFDIPEGQYCFYSSFGGQTTSYCEDNQQARGDDVFIATTSAPTIRLQAEGTFREQWAARTLIDILLLGHTGGSEYDIYFNPPSGSDMLVTSSITTTNGRYTHNDWLVLPEAAFPSPCLPSGQPCLMESRPTDGGAALSTREFYITEPVIQLFSSSFKRGESVRYELIDHTPNTEYTVIATRDFSGTKEIVYQTTFEVDATGRSLVNSFQLLIDTWEDGVYEITSYRSGTNLLSELDNGWIAPAQSFTVDTPIEPYLTIDGGGDTFPAGTCIGIELWQHTADTNHFLRFGNNTVPIASSADDTFLTGNLGQAEQEYCIPNSTLATTYQIASFLEGDNPSFDTPQATLDVEVTSQPYLEVYVDGELVPDGDSVLPDETITVQMYNHVPFETHQVLYAEKVINISIQPDANGFAAFDYDLDFLPSGSPDPRLNLGTAFDLYSRDSNSNRVATTTLALKPTDLAITDIQLIEPNLPGTWTSELFDTGNDYINKPITIAVTYQNETTVPISRYFDIDIYQNPQPYYPITYIRQSAVQIPVPGDIKRWQNTMNGNQSRVEIVSFDLYDFGEHTFHGVVDTSDYVTEIDEENNALFRSLTLSCNAGGTSIELTSFASPNQVPQNVSFGFDSAAEISDWSLVDNGNQAPVAPTVTNGQLVMNTTGGKGLGSNKSRRSPTFYYSQPLTDAVIATVEIPASFNVDDAGDDARAGIALSTIASTQVDFATEDFISFSIIRRNVADPHYRFRASTINNSGALREVTARANGPVKMYDADFPITLRIVVNASDKTRFSLQYKRSGDPNFIEWDRSGSLVSRTPIDGPLYLALFSTAVDKNNNFAGPMDATFDNASVDYFDSAHADNWLTQVYGSADVSPDPPGGVGGVLELSNTGRGNLTLNDGTANTGYAMYYRTDPTTVSIESGFEARTVIDAMDDLSSTVGSMAGIEIRQDLTNGSSAKIEFGLVRQADGTYIPYPAYRPANGSETALADTSSLPSFDLSAGKVFLRMVREEGTGIFRFYAFQRAAGTNPANVDWATAGGETSGNPLISNPELVAGLGTSVYIGLFNAPNNRQDSYQTAKFSYFYVDFTSCSPGAGPAQAGGVSDSGIPVNPPPGLQLCQKPLDDTGFELRDGTWVFGARPGVSYGAPGNRDSNVKLLASTNNTQTPFFYQEFTMPSWIITGSTTFDVQVYQNLNDYSDVGLAANSLNDYFYAAIVTTPPDVFAQLGDPSPDTWITKPISFTNGNMPTAVWDGTDWRINIFELPLVDGINPESLVGNTYYLLIYNSTNGTDCATFGACVNTDFYFDDLELNVCTTEPAPTVVTQPYIQGVVTVHQLDRDTGAQTEQTIAGIPVWAYTEGGELYQTFTIQNGQYTFYDLPANTQAQGGTRYTIYSEYSVNKTSYIELLADSRTVIFTSDGSPVTGANLDLYDLQLDLVSN